MKGRPRADIKGLWRAGIGPTLYFVGPYRTGFKFRDIKHIMSALPRAEKYEEFVSHRPLS